MIQRIQTVYMAMVIILTFTGLISTLGSYTVGVETAATFNAFAFSTTEAYDSYQSAGPWCLSVLSIMVILLTAISIMLFRKRMRQLRLLIMSTILLLGYIACYSIFAYKYMLSLEDAFTGTQFEFQLPFVAVFPACCVILNALAIHGIRKDEALVRSLDRLR